MIRARFIAGAACLISLWGHGLRAQEHGVPEHGAQEHGAQDPGPPSFALPPPSTLSFYGAPGLMDMPTGEMMPDAQFGATLGGFAGQWRYTLTFQGLPWVSGSFRYNGIRDLNRIPGALIVVDPT